MLDVCLLGTGGMMPLPYRWLTAMMARCDGSSLLIDCGEGTQVALKEKGWSPRPIDVICFTHYHADHISGLPGLLLTMGNAERTEPLTLIGPRGLERVVSALRMIAPELPFPLRFIELEENRKQLKAGPYVIDAYRVNHNVVCYGYTISIPRAGRFDVERARAAFGVAGPVPLRACRAEELACGQPVSLELAERFAQAVKEDINPRDSWRAARDFRMHIAVESAKRAFVTSVRLAGGAL